MTKVGATHHPRHRPSKVGVLLNPLALLGHPVEPGFSIWWTALGLVPDSILSTWVFNNTRGSLLLALLLHSSIAITGAFVPLLEVGPAVQALLGWVVPLAVIAVYGPASLSRHVADETLSHPQTQN